MEGVEFDELVRFEEGLFTQLSADTRITSRTISDWHRNWLDTVYEWAGEYRSVNMSKEGFIFAAAHLIPSLMDKFEKGFLSIYTPCIDMSEKDLITALAICHVEFIIIHPFREGNGRLGRVLSTVMALQADMPVLDFEILENDNKRYIAAIHAGHAGDYKPMEQLFSDVLAYSIKQSSQTGHDA
jgi:cell filamentation protein